MFPHLHRHLTSGRQCRGRASAGSSSSSAHADMRPESAWASRSRSLPDKSRYLAISREILLCNVIRRHAPHALVDSTPTLYPLCPTSAREPRVSLLYVFRLRCESLVGSCELSVVLCNARTAFITPRETHCLRRLATFN